MTREEPVANGHLACSPSRRGHTWRATAYDAADLRVCDRCGEVGRISKQGIVVATGRKVAP